MSIKRQLRASVSSPYDADISDIRLDTFRASVIKRHASIADKARRLQHVGSDDGLKYIELEMTIGATDRYGNIVADDLGANHSKGFGLGRIYLPGMIDEPGSLSGMVISSIPERGQAKHANVVGDLHE